MPSVAVRAVLDTSTVVSALLFGGRTRELALATIVVPEPIERTVPTDADDDAVVATALAAGAELIVTGDSDLLAMHPFQGIRIYGSADALASIRGAPGDRDVSCLSWCADTLAVAAAVRLVSTA